MKKIIGIVIASMMFANIGYAEAQVIKEYSNVKLGAIKRIDKMWTICIDGYKFLLYGRPLVQFFEERDGKSLPAKC